MAVCKNCGAMVSSSANKCNACGTPQQSPKSPGGYCGKCGTPLTAKYSPCPNCAHVKTSFGQPAAPNPQQAFPSGATYKNQGTALVLAVILGFIGICGIGHFYLGKISRGVIILIVGIILGVITVASGFIGLIVYIPFLIWTLYDANSSCKYYNHFLSTKSHAPW